MKSNFCFVFIILSFDLFGQTVLFLDELENQTSKEYAKYYQIGTLDLNGNIIGMSKTYRIADSSLYSSANFFNGVVNGTYEAFYDNGNLKEKGKISSGSRYGNWNEYYENGQIKTTVLYTYNFPNEIQNFYSIDGDTLVINGNGRIIERHENGNVKFFGEIKNGLMNREWEFFSETGKLESKLFYENGIFKKGTNYCFKKPLDFSEPNIRASPKKGWTDFYMKLQKKSKGKFQNINTKVTISFIVNENGKVENFEVVNGYNEEIDKDAISLVKSMPKWNPAIVHGKAKSAKLWIEVEY